MRLDRIGDLFRLTVVQRVIAAHDALQLGKLADHVGGKVGLAQVGSALGSFRVCFQLARNFPGECLDALHALELAAELVVIDDTGKPRHARFEPCLAVLVVEELRVGQPRAQHALVAVDDFARLLRLDVRHEQKAGQELARRLVAQGHVLLVLLHGEHETFLGHFEEFCAEGSLVHRRCFHQRGDLVVERVARDWNTGITT